jgi:hypothetical protein
VLIFLVLPSWKALQKGKAQYGCTNLFRSGAFSTENVIYPFYKSSKLNEEVNCSEPSPQLVFPVPSFSKKWPKISFCGYFIISKKYDLSNNSQPVGNRNLGHPG